MSIGCWPLPGDRGAGARGQVTDPPRCRPRVPSRRRFRPGADGSWRHDLHPRVALHAFCPLQIGLPAAPCGANPLAWR
jgi:hypothetical protein